MVISAISMPLLKSPSNRVGFSMELSNPSSQLRSLSAPSAMTIQAYPSSRAVPCLGHRRHQNPPAPGLRGRTWAPQGQRYRPAGSTEADRRSRRDRIQAAAAALGSLVAAFAVRGGTPWRRHSGDNPRARTPEIPLPPLRAGQQPAFTRPAHRFLVKLLELSWGLPPPAPGLHVDQQPEDREGHHQHDLIEAGIGHQDVGEEMGDVGD